MLYRLFYALNFDPIAPAYCPILGLSAERAEGIGPHHSVLQVGPQPNAEVHGGGL